MAKVQEILLLVLDSNTTFMAEFACKKPYAFKGYLGDTFLSRDITIVSWRVSGLSFRVS